MAWLTRFLTAIAFLALGILFSPETFGSKSNPSSKLSITLKLSHLLSFSTAWGAALWVTFIGGIIMFKNLPRHQFGNLQSKMFPAYFGMVSICCAISVGAFAYLHPWKSAETTEKYQLGFLISAFAFNLTNLLVFTPMTVELMKQRHKIEREVNIGEEVGWTKNKEVAKTNPKLAAMNKKFGMIHGLSSLANIFVSDGNIPAIKVSTYKRRLGIGGEPPRDEPNSHTMPLGRSMGSEFSCMIKEAKLLGKALGIPCLDG